MVDCLRRLASDGGLQTPVFKGLPSQGPRDCTWYGEEPFQPAGPLIAEAGQLDRNGCQTNYGYLTQVLARTLVLSPGEVTGN